LWSPTLLTFILEKTRVIFYTPEFIQFWNWKAEKAKNDHNLSITKLNYIKRNVYNMRKSILLLLPKSIDEVHYTINLMDMFYEMIKILIL
jgi:hypothetical protein